MLIGGLPTSVPFPLSQCLVPTGIDGPVAIWITSDSQPLINSPVDRAVDKQVAGPTIAFIDTKSQLLGQLAHTPQGTPPPSVVTTVNLDQATSIISNASPMSTSTSPMPTSTSSDVTYQGYWR
jgi:hypothetical protein